VARRPPVFRRVRAVVPPAAHAPAHEAHPDVARPTAPGRRALPERGLAHAGLDAAEVDLVRVRTGAHAEPGCAGSKLRVSAERRVRVGSRGRGAGSGRAARAALRPGAPRRTAGFGPSGASSRRRRRFCTSLWRGGAFQPEPLRRPSRPHAASERGRGRGRRLALGTARPRHVFFRKEVGYGSEGSPPLKQTPCHGVKFPVHLKVSPLKDDAYMYKLYWYGEIKIYAVAHQSRSTSRQILLSIQ
jgi:hypothetical protein